MKTLKETLELTNELVIRNTDTHNTCFMDFSGHVNKLSIHIYPLGFERKELVDKYCVYNGYLNTETEINLAYFSILQEIEKYK
tara:strand:+ start:597 stop:845 length:249 start_codon:yes stop_codon:yes gene_type:complete